MTALISRSLALAALADTAMREIERTTGVSMADVQRAGQKTARVAASGETAALMGALGCRRAVLLDGGISGQLLVRGRGAEAQTWRGLRKVPLGLIAVPR